MLGGINIFSPQNFFSGGGPQGCIYEDKLHSRLGLIFSHCQVVEQVRMALERGQDVAVPISGPITLGGFGVACPDEFRLQVLQLAVMWMLQRSAIL